MFCPNCGKKNNDNSKFCMNCGSPLKMNDSPQEVHTRPTARRATQSRTSSSGTILINISKALVALSIIATALFAFSISSYDFNVRNKTDDSYWGPGQHWICVTAAPTMLPSDIFGLSATDVVYRNEVPATIERLKLKAEKRYLKQTKELTTGSCAAVVITLLFLTLVKKLSR